MRNFCQPIGTVYLFLTDSKSKAADRDGSRDGTCTGRTFSPAASSVWDFRAAEKKSYQTISFNPTSWLVNLPFMAKNKGKRSSGANANVPDGGVPVNDSNAAGDAFPQLQEGAFAGLRQKIEQKLKDQNAAKQKKNDNKNNNKLKEAPKETPKQNNKQAAPTQAAKRGSGADKNNQGKKRDRNGDVIARGGKKETETKPSKSSGMDENDTLRQEILALGGTEEDLDLLAGIESDSEVEGAKEAPKKSNNKSDDDFLRKELSSMLAAAGQVVPDDLPDDEAEAEDEEDEEEEDDEVEDVELDVDEDDFEEGSDGNVSSDQEDSPPPTKKETKKQKGNQDPIQNTLPKEYAKLVSVHGRSLVLPYTNTTNRQSPRDLTGTTPNFLRYLRSKSTHCPDT